MTNRINLKTVPLTTALIAAFAVIAPTSAQAQDNEPAQALAVNAPVIMIMEKASAPQLRVAPTAFTPDFSQIMGTPTTLRMDQRVFGSFSPDTAITRRDEAAIFAEIQTRFGSRARTERPATGFQFKPDVSMALHTHGADRLAIGQDAIQTQLSAKY